MFRRIISAALCLALLLCCIPMLSGCETNVGAEEYPLTIADTTIEKRPQRVVCASTLLTEVIVEIGCTDTLVGRPFDCTLPETLSLPAVGTAAAPSVDAIKNLTPDLVILDRSAPAEDIAKLAEAGIDTLVLDIAIDRLSFRNLYACIGAAIKGAVTGQEQGIAAAERILIALDDIERATMSEEPVNVVIFTDELISEVINGQHIATMCIELAGGFNLCVDQDGTTAVLNEIAPSNPGVILCLEGTEGLLHSKRELQNSNAFSDNRIHAFDSSKFNCLGSGLITATWEMARILHPTLITPEMLPEDAINYIVDESIVIFNELDEESEQ